MNMIKNINFLLRIEKENRALQSTRQNLYALGLSVACARLGWGDQVKIDQGLLAADKYWRKQENNTLENLAQTAQNLRQEDKGESPEKALIRQKD